MDYSGPQEQTFQELLDVLGVSEHESASSVRLEGEPPVLKSPHRIGLASSLALLAQGAATASLWEQRGGRPQQVSLDARDSVAALNPIPWFRRNGHPVFESYGLEPPHGYFPTRDGRVFFLTMAWPKLLNNALRVLDCPNERTAITAAIAARDSADLEQAAIEAGLTGTTVLTSKEWREHPQGLVSEKQPLIEIERIADAPPIPLGKAARPLGGIRVADLTHVFAGPMLSRSLAEQGADVLHLGPLRQHLIDPIGMTIVTGIGKRSAALDYANQGGPQLTSLLPETDVFVQSWRPGVHERQGFGPEQVAAIRPGIIYISVSCFGFEGPWASRAGFDPVALAASGMTDDEARWDTYKFSPPGILTDTVGAFLGAGAVAATLGRRAREGGSWHIKISLVRIASWIQSLGLYPDGTPPDPVHRPFLHRMESPFGALDYPAPPLRYSETVAYFDKPSVPVGGSRLEWLPAPN